jgi:hypothetical protein
VVLIIVLVVVSIRTYAKIGSKPVIYSLNDSELAIDPFEQAKDLLNTLFPLFSAVVTFWLGATIEGKRADENKRQAEEEKTQRKEVEEDKRRVVDDATAALAQVEGMVQALPLREETVEEELQAAEALADPRQEILDVLQRARQSLR